MAKLSDVLEELCQDNGDIRSISLLHNDIYYDENRILFECDEYTECCILIHSEGYFDELYDGRSYQKSLRGYIKTVSLISKDGLSTAEFAMVTRSKNITKLVGLLKEDYPLVKDKFTQTEHIEHRQRSIEELLNLIQLN